MAEHNNVENHLGAPVIPACINLAENLYGAAQQPGIPANAASPAWHLP